MPMMDIGDGVLHVCDMISEFRLDCSECGGSGVGGKLSIQSIRQD